MCNRDEFFVESKETKQGVTLLVKEEVTLPAEVSEKGDPLLEESKKVIHDELSEGLSPMKNIQPHIDFISEESQSNFLHCRINPMESEVLKDEDFEKI